MRIQHLVWYDSDDKGSRFGVLIDFLFLCHLSISWAKEKRFKFRLQCFSLEHLVPQTLLACLLFRETGCRDMINLRNWP